MKTSTEKDWLKAVQDVFQAAKRQNPPTISRSEIQSLIIGLESSGNIPLGTPLSPAGEKTLEMLKGYLDIMTRKNKKFLPIKN